MLSFLSWKFLICLSEVNFACNSLFWDEFTFRGSSRFLVFFLFPFTLFCSFCFSYDLFSHDILYCFSNKQTNRLVQGEGERVEDYATFTYRHDLLGPTEHCESNEVKKVEKRDSRESIFIYLFFWFTYIVLFLNILPK